MSDNPFERWDLDPMAGPEAITEQLRKLAESTTDEQTRAEIREAWEALTMHPRGRLDAALGAHPETRLPLGRPPRPFTRPALAPFAPAELVLEDVVAWPGVAAALGPPVNPSDLPDVLPDADPILVSPKHGESL